MMAKYGREYLSTNGIAAVALKIDAVAIY